MSGLSEDDLRGMVARASTLPERLAREPVLIPEPGDAAATDRRLERWCQLAAHGDLETLRRLLSWDGLDVEHLRSAIGPVRLAENAPLPDWAITLKAVVEDGARAPHPAGPPQEPPERFLSSHQPLPFEEI